MYLKRIMVDGFRAAVPAPITVDLPGRFSLLVGSNGVGKTTINDAIYLAHPDRFPRLAPPDAAVLGSAPRNIAVEYAFEGIRGSEGALGQALQRIGTSAPLWVRSLERSMGRVRARTVAAAPDGLDQLRLIYLPALRNPVDELSRRETRVLLELLRAEQLRNPSTGTLIDIRRQAESLLSSLTTHQLLADVQGRIAQNMKVLTAGVQEHFPFIGTQRVDDGYLARVLELVLAATNDAHQARRLEGSSLGYVNLLHIAVTLAGVPDPSKSPGAMPGDGPAGTGIDVPAQSTAQATSAENAETARRRLEDRSEEADDQVDSFFPQLFHATVLIEEPEAHLHPQLQHGLIRYLRKVTVERPDLQVIVSTHASEIVAACKPDEMVVVRRENGRVLTRALANIPWKTADREKITRMAALHMDASRSGALFADRVVLVEGITEAALLRAFGRVWSRSDSTKFAFIDALSIVPIGNKVGEWPVRLLVHPGWELASQVAVLSDTDKRGDPLPDPTPTAWQSDFTDPTRFKVFWSRPTLEPTLVEHNEILVEKVLALLGESPTEAPTAQSIDDLFQTSSGKKRKGEFAFELAALVDANASTTHVPSQLVELFD
ncbi:AAA family ATPase [Rhodococcus sp. IEGM 1366]|uniref:ATP-dependent nuclease n=1 Tax=Rhodococcus sp. IEGM 1366 TaxID=3082223 RepID=UPI0029541F1F|nr:AAA family ATPase [Rhodococcus sp. IEGM 1366]MDV8071164.1 AAA family ATPase [Rhodococcus sp. IEGM 1366]